MLYGNEKSRQMARSILPSRYRWAAEEQRRLRRRHRRAVRQVLAVASIRGEGIDDVDVLTRWPQRTIKDHVFDRRSGDKINHLFRWAEAASLAQPPEDRAAWVRRQLPEGLIGAHAMSHLEWSNVIVPPHEHDLRGRWATVRRGPQPDVLAERLRDLVEHGGHAAINDFLRRHGFGLYVVEGDPHWRRLLGLHDCVDFAAWFTTRRDEAAVLLEWLRRIGG